MGGFLILIGLLAIIIGIITLIKPLDVLRISTLGMAAGILVLGFLLFALGGNLVSPPEEDSTVVGLVIVIIIIAGGLVYFITKSKKKASVQEGTSNDSDKPEESKQETYKATPAPTIKTESTQATEANKETTETSNNTEMKMCKSCKEQIKKEATTCPYCREKQPSKAGGIGCLIFSSLVIVIVIFLFIIGPVPPAARHFIEIAERDPFVGFEIEVDYDDLEVEKIRERSEGGIREPEVTLKTYTVSGPIKRAEDGKRYHIEGMITLLEGPEGGRWGLETLKLNGEKLH